MRMKKNQLMHLPHLPQSEPDAHKNNRSVQRPSPDGLFFLLRSMLRNIHLPPHR